MTKGERNRNLGTALVGRLVKIVGNSGRHGFNLGQTVKIYEFDNEFRAVSLKGNNRYNLQDDDFELIPITLQEHLDELDYTRTASAAKEKDLQEKIDYLKEISKDVLDLDDFKAAKILEDLKSGDFDKAKDKIRELIAKK